MNATVALLGIFAIASGVVVLTFGIYTSITDARKARRPLTERQRAVVNGAAQLVAGADWNVQMADRPHVCVPAPLYHDLADALDALGAT